MDELEWEIAQVDPKKTIQMGSFRINPDGSQSVVEVTVTIPPNKITHSNFEGETQLIKKDHSLIEMKKTLTHRGI